MEEKGKFNGDDICAGPVSIQVTAHCGGQDGGPPCFSFCLNLAVPCYFSWQIGLKVNVDGGS